MNEILVRTNGGEKRCSLHDSVESVLGLRRDCRYEDNPVVGVLLNGILSPLGTRIGGDSEIEEVRLFSTLGKRIYRKTLTLVLMYTSFLTYPERTLVIGHSLGDGFYFHYRDGQEFDLELLKKKMTSIIRAGTPIEEVVLRHEDAIAWARRHKLDETERLLSSENESGYRFLNMGTYYQLYTEPVLPDTHLLSVWELRSYQGGLLLRYPQTRSIDRIREFTDNPLLFSVFQESRRNARTIGLENLGELNHRQSSNRIEETILLLEAQQRRKITRISEDIAGRSNVRIVFIAGPSSSGKTTFSLKLSEELKVMGMKPIKISLDDYYKPRSEAPRDENGDFDFEILEALNLDLFRSQLAELLEGKPVNLPTFSFKEQKRTFSSEACRMGEKSVLIIEGIHGLNPGLVPGIDQKLIYRVYISALTQLNLDSCSRISTSDNRILRRLVRDYRTRGIDAVETFNRWPSVERGEKNHIFPYQNNADVMINSALDYELGVLAPKAVPLLKSVGKNEKEAYAIARRLLFFLSFVYPIDSSLVPSDSLLREFIGGSIYGAI